MDGFKIPDSYDEAEINKARGTFKIADAAAEQGPKGEAAGKQGAAPILSTARSVQPATAAPPARPACPPTHASARNMHSLPCAAAPPSPGELRAVFTIPLPKEPANKVGGGPRGCLHPPSAQHALCLACPAARRPAAGPVEPAAFASARCKTKAPLLL